MQYREIVAVTGIGGLYQLMSTKSDGAIVRNLSDKTTKFIPARVHNVTPIESIEIYTTDENVRLHIILQAMTDNESKTPIVDAKKADNAAIKSYFQTVFPAIDQERVYVSDMKKILKWYQLLKENNLLDFAAYNEAETAAEPTPEPDAPVAEEAPKPTKKAKVKKAAAPTDTEEVAPKKTARKKKTEE